MSLYHVPVVFIVAEHGYEEGQMLAPAGAESASKDPQ
jgi:hypothetical protein